MSGLVLISVELLPKQPHDATAALRACRALSHATLKEGKMMKRKLAWWASNIWDAEINKRKRGMEAKIVIWKINSDYEADSILLFT